MQAPEPKKAQTLFRKEALEYTRTAAREQGDVMHLSPAWTRWTYWLLVSLTMAAVGYCLVGRVYEYASGPAIIRVEGRTDLTQQLPGVVSSVKVVPGQRVEAGDTLVTFLSEEESSSLARLEREFELQLLRFMRDPADTAARQALTSLSAERELAQARVEARSLKAPHAGFVGDVRILPGQFLQPGTRVLSLTAEDAPVTLWALLPGHFRPLLRPGMPLRVELDGFRYDYHQLTIDEVGDQIIGPTEVRRFVGPDLSDAINVEGPIVLVKARVPSQTFLNEGRVLSYFDGMPSRAEARVRSERILLMLMPGLKGFFSNE